MRSDKFRTGPGYLWVAAMVLVLSGSSGISCPIPVFQYALENWAVDPYEVIVFHQGEFSEECKKALAGLNDAEAGKKAIANIRLTIRAEDAGHRASKQTPPYMEIRYPVHARLRDSIWSGPLSVKTVQSAVNSPIREKLGSLLLDRKTAVWILLEGKQRSKNNAVYKLLRDELGRLEKTLVLPDSARWEDQTVKIFDTISFDILRLRRNDPKEQMLVQMLLRSEKDLVDFGDVPIVFPIYGRGLILYALVDKGINAHMISEAAQFLAGPCSCQIKAGSPGLDLLMSVDWEANIEPMTILPPPAPVGTGGFLRRLKQAEDEFDGR